MKNVEDIIACTIFIVISLMFAVRSYARIDSETAVGIWLLDEGSGKSARDISGNDNDGEIMGKPKWVDGKFGKALEFGEETDWVQIKDNPSLRVTKEVTVMAWINPVSYTFPGVRWQGIIAKSNNPRSYSFYTDDSGQFLLAIHFGGQHFVGMSQGVPPLKEWSHVAAAAETTPQGGNMKLFMNGKLTKETPFPALKGLPGDSDTQDVLIGRTWEDARFFQGMIDEVAIFNVALSEDDINSIATKGLSRATGITAVSISGKIAAAWAAIKAQ